MNALKRRPRRSLERARLDPPDPRVLFFRDFLLRPKQVGSIIPSSRFLERRVVRGAELASARTVVELGPGTGGTTRALLRALPADGRLLVIEINPRFAGLIRRSIDDPRLRIEVGDASDLARHLERHGLPTPDVVVSGIPFSTMPRTLGLRILRAVHDVLAPGGRFVAYQVRDRVAVLGRSIFGPAKMEAEIRNVPPMRVWRWVKPVS
jgi:phospholipid N-methyltransferase